MKAEEILQTASHRSYPPPQTPWIMRQSWHELLFAHWPIAPAVLQNVLPACFEIDTFAGEAWIGVVPFRMSDVRPRGLFAFQQLSQFPELNVRTYVTMNGQPGVYFFSLDAGNPIAVALARSVFHLPYFNALMQCQRLGDTIYYRSQRTHRGAARADFIARYRPTGRVTYAHPQSIAAWLTERYCLYTNIGRQAYRANIHHVQWPLQPAEVEVSRNTMADAHGIQLPASDPLLYYAHRLDVLVWPIQKIE